MVIDKDLHKKHILLNEIGSKGQEKIHNSKVLIIGLGGLASPAIRYLASSGVNNFTLIDDDIIELDNLPRQNNYDLNDIGISRGDIRHIAQTHYKDIIEENEAKKRLYTYPNVNLKGWV